MKATGSIGDIRAITVVGASGKMGRLFVTRSRQAGLTAFELDRPYDSPKGIETCERDLPRSDLLVLSVPAQAMGDVLGKLLPYVPEGCIIADVCSVKVRPLEEMVRLYPGPVVGTHPLFGPVPPEDVVPKVAVCPGRPGDEAAAQAVEAWFTLMGFGPFRATPQEHDRAMAYVQGLNFVTTVAYLATGSFEDLDRYLTPSFKRRLAAAKKLITEDAGLFRLIYEANPHSLEMVRAFRNYLNVAAGGDLELLVERAKGWWKKEDGSAASAPHDTTDK